MASIGGGCGRDVVSLPGMAVGRLSCRLVNRFTGESVPFAETKNMMSYAAADAIAAAYAGDTSLCPTHMGFVYGASGDMDLSPPATRDMAFPTASSLGNNANIQVVRLSGTPELVASDTSSALYKKNSVVFRACTRSSGDSGSDLYPVRQDIPLSGDGMHMYYALLLGKGAGTGKYSVLAASRFPAVKEKPENYDLAVEWTVSFF